MQPVWGSMAVSPFRRLGANPPKDGSRLPCSPKELEIRGCPIFPSFFFFWLTYHYFTMSIREYDSWCSLPRIPMRSVHDFGVMILRLGCPGSDRSALGCQSHRYGGQAFVGCPNVPQESGTLPTTQELNCRVTDPGESGRRGRTNAEPAYLSSGRPIDTRSFRISATKNGFVRGALAAVRKNGPWRSPRPATKASTAATGQRSSPVLPIITSTLRPN